jgi:hypothetical protein
MGAPDLVCCVVVNAQLAELRPCPIDAIDVKVHASPLFTLKTNATHATGRHSPRSGS